MLSVSSLSIVTLFWDVEILDNDTGLVSGASSLGGFIIALNSE